jgi:hypothetical protein
MSGCDQADAEAEVSVGIVGGAIRTGTAEPIEMNSGDAAQLINDFTQLATMRGARILTEHDCLIGYSQRMAAVP